MAFPRNSLRAFLTHAKAPLRAALKQQQKLTFVIGNESADLDSFTSSLLYAYLRSIHPPPTPHLYIPILNIPATDLPIRPEFAALCTHANISTSHLITLDDLSPPSSLPPERTRWILVDHSKFQGKLGEAYKQRVVGVIDHHDDEGAIPMSLEGEGHEPRVIEKCGSCTSLVVRELRDTWDHLSSAALSSGASHGQGDDGAVDDAAVVRVWDAQVAKMALASIVIDTRNLTDASKTKETDREAVRYLEGKIRLSGKEGKEWNRGKFYEEIDKAKVDIGNLKLEDILRKDYKEWTEAGIKLGISSVVKPLEFLVGKAREEAGVGGKGEGGEGEDGNKNGKGADANKAFNKALASFISTRKLVIYTIMTTSTSSSGSFQRQLLLQSSPESSQAAEKFEKTATEELDLAPVSEEIGIRSYGGEGKEDKDEEEEGEGWRRVWQQRNVGASRKRVAPLLRKAMAAGGGDENK